MLMEKRLYWDGSSFRTEQYYWDSPGILSQQMKYNNTKALLIDLSEEFTIAWTNILYSDSSKVSLNVIQVEPISESEAKAIRPVEKRALTSGALLITVSISLIVMSMGLCAI